MSLSKSGLSSHLHVLELARGGMGRVEVVLRREGQFTRLLAVKRLLSEYRKNEEFRRMFLDEARVAGLLRHPNIISVIDVGEDNEGPYLVMDFIEGLSVSKLIGTTARRGALLPVQLCARIVRDIAAGLHAAHELCSRDGQPLNLVHRDVTPHNVLLSYAGEVLVADFGIAKVMGQSNKTSTGVLKGKLGYMAPEQLRFHEPDRRSDLFSMGVVFFELLSARRAYTGEGMEAARHILEDPPPDILEHRDDVDDELVALLFDLLAKNPADRPASAEAVVKRLDTAIANLLVEEEPISVKAYLDDHYEEERRTARERLDAAVAEATSRSEVRQAKAKKARVGKRVAALGAAAIIGLGTVIVLDPSSADEEPAPRTDVQTVETVQPTPAPLPPALPVDLAPPSDEGANSPEPETPRRARVTMRRRRPPEREAEGTSTTEEAPTMEGATPSEMSSSMFAHWGAGSGE